MKEKRTYASYYHKLYAKNKATIISNYAKRRALSKARIFMFFGPYCACCGESNQLFLSIDHVKNDGRYSSSGNLYFRVIREGFPRDRYQVLCMNCNWGKHQNGGICPHKSASSHT